ncbi:hypothetical protein [Isoptericola croceus]|uniref:hypothetical protein n=1 Tax=Isoptericola croceus TaxID=3031406 RepID=UPI0023F93F78|nr:hypothetical protein [Isoptericola croceus]
MKPSDDPPTTGPDADAPAASGRRRGPRRAVRRGAERETVWGATSDDQGDQGDHDSNDDQLRRDVPPHW